MESWQKAVEIQRCTKMENKLWEFLYLFSANHVFKCSSVIIKEHQYIELFQTKHDQGSNQKKASRQHSLWIISSLARDYKGISDGNGVCILQSSVPEYICTSSSSLFFIVSLPSRSNSCYRRRCKVTMFFYSWTSLTPCQLLLGFVSAILPLQLSLQFFWAKSGRSDNEFLDSLIDWFQIIFSFIYTLWYF